MATGLIGLERDHQPPERRIQQIGGGGVYHDDEGQDDQEKSGRDAASTVTRPSGMSTIGTPMSPSDAPSSAVL